FPKFHALKYRGETTSIAALQSKLLNKQSTFVEYFVGDSSTFAFVITQNSTDFLQLKNPSTLQKEAANFFEVLLNPKAFQQDAKTAFVDYQNKASILYQSVLQPVLSSLSTDIQQLIIVPDGFLNAIPLEALTKTSDTTPSFDFAKLPYILYDYSIQYAYSADLLLQNQERQSQIPTNAECLAFAPSYQETGTIAERGNLRNTGGNLKGTALEIEAIAQFFDGQFDFGETATERQFKKFAPEFGMLHLAMHGIPDFDNANFNHLQFSNLETDTLEDNLLHHYEIANMDLQAQLVVLSACETGVGKYEKGEGVYSLTRSFMYAGVPSVVMSLWKVSDASTSELMPYLYENLYDGQSKERALQSAKLRFLEESDLEYRHPFYWSAFVMMGDGTAIHRGHGSWIWWGIGGLVLMGIGGWISKNRYFIR
ncbi:MAG: CHAT domain-containing protein, partial [Chitinophagales bacterium]